MSHLPLDAIAPEAAPGIRILPVLHERVDLAALARRVLDALDPAAVAVELPTTLAEAADTAVARLPKISVVISEDDPSEALVWVVAPGDPLVEALRWARERGREAHLVDPDVRYRHRHRDLLPDPWVLWSLGPERYLATVRALVAEAPRDDVDSLREHGMAFHIRQAAAATDGTLLCLVGAAHAEAVAQHLEGPTAPPLARQRRSQVLVRHLHPESMTALMPDPPLAHAVFELLRDGRLPEPTDFAATVSRRVELLAAGLRLVTGSSPDDTARRRQALVRYAAHRATRRASDGAPVPDRAALGAVVWRVGAASYSEQTREATHTWQRRMFFDFARRYARVQGLLVPGLYEWAVAARGVADDNLAWEVFDAARTYPWQEEQAELQTARVDGDMLDLGTRTVRFRRRFFRVKHRPVAVPVRQRPGPEDAAEWLSGFDGEGICSYPPEDVVVEDYGRFLQRKAVSILSAERTRSEPFTTSMLDGVDIRETMRHWLEEQVWVREQGRAPGAAGAVVVVFDPDPDGTAYPPLMTWLGEHDQESDMAFYASDPTEQVVGPGIMRATYGGFMLTYPPGRLFDVWHDPDYATARSKPEVLLMAAVDYSQEKLVVHVASRPPSPRLHAFAAEQRKRIVHIPLGSLSPATLRKLRVVHILHGRDKRAIAKGYVW
jgi:hypothetical protein